MRGIIIGILVTILGWGGLWWFVTSLTEEDLAGSTGGFDGVSAILLGIGGAGIATVISSIRCIRKNRKAERERERR